MTEVLAARLGKGRLFAGVMAGAASDQSGRDRRVACEGEIPPISERKQDRSFVLGRLASGDVFSGVPVVDLLEALIAVEKTDMHGKIREALAGFLGGAAHALDLREEGRTGVVVRDGDGWAVCLAS